LIQVLEQECQFIAMSRKNPIPDACSKSGLAAIQSKMNLLGDVADWAGVGRFEINVSRAKKHFRIKCGAVLEVPPFHFRFPVPHAGIVLQNYLLNDCLIKGAGLE
jgi:hypothetical protein